MAQLPRRIARDDDSIPASIRAIWPDAVPAISVLGVWPPPIRAIAIIGSSQPNPIARSWAFDLAREAVRHDWNVVSGLARGIDGAAHEGALAGGGTTTAVIGSPFAAVYPPEHRVLHNQLLVDGGTSITLDNVADVEPRQRLLLRNQLTSAFSRVVVAVQSAGRDGALATMRHGFLQGRLLATITPPDDHTCWNGNRLLLSDTSPWKTRLTWQPATPISPDAFAEFFLHLDGMIEQFDVTRSTPDTAHSPSPLRLWSTDD